MITYKMHWIRTGKTSPGPRDRCVGQLDLPLSAEGEEELRSLRSRYRYPAVQTVYTSPLERCVATADILYPHVYTRIAGDLIDMNLGDFEGRSYRELGEDDAFRLWVGDSRNNPPPGGEGTESFTARVIAATRGIFRDMMDEKLTNVAVIAHSGVIMTLLAAIGLPRAPIQQWAVGNGAGYTLLFTPQMWMRDGCAEVYAQLPQMRGDDPDDGDWEIQ